jgi:phytoene synthase
VHNPAILSQAERMGHAMQLSNILRDVGEDWSRGRLYLPLEVMRRHGVTEADLEAMYLGAPLSHGYRSLVAELLDQAESDYAAALEGVPALPPELRRSVAVAAHVYRGIHREIRRNGYDNLRRRAFTSPVAKAALATRALWELTRASHRRVGAAGQIPSLLSRAGEE